MPDIYVWTPKEYWGAKTIPYLLFPKPISNHIVEYLCQLKILKESDSTISLSTKFQYLITWNSSYYLIYNLSAVKIKATVLFYALGGEGEQFVTRNQTIINVPKPESDFEANI